MKQLEVQIMGQSYLLGCPEGGEAQLQAAVERVDMAMCRIRDAGKVKARDRIAVLAALNLAFDLANRPEPTAAAEPEPAHEPAPVPAASPPAPSESEPARQAPPSPTSAAPAAAAQSTEYSDALADLLRRLDAVLQEDGQLL